LLHLVRGDGDSEKHREFNDEYLSVMDLTAGFCLQTIDTVFVRHALPKGEMVHRGRQVDLKAIRRVPLMTIEGEKDDITGIGQCAAALNLCANIPPPTSSISSARRSAITASSTAPAFVASSRRASPASCANASARRLGTVIGPRCLRRGGEAGARHPFAFSTLVILEGVTAASAFGDHRHFAGGTI
jgi:hypothetical protein